MTTLHQPRIPPSILERTYSLCYVVNNNGAVGITVVHGRKRLVALLSCSIPYLELDGSIIIQGDRLGEERSADGRLAVIIELILAVLTISQGCVFQKDSRQYLAPENSL